MILAASSAKSHRQRSSFALCQLPRISSAWSSLRTRTSVGSTALARRVAHVLLVVAVLVTFIGPAFADRDPAILQAVRRLVRALEDEVARVTGRVGPAKENPCMAREVAPPKSTGGGGYSFDPSESIQAPSRGSQERGGYHEPCARSKGSDRRGQARRR